MPASDSLSLYDPLFRPGLIAGLAVAVQCAPLSVLVVLKRLSFMSQGVSHAAFGGMGLALLLGLTTGAAFGVVAAFCILTALGIAWITDRKTGSADTIIGVFLVGAMALGAILVSIHFRSAPHSGATFSWEGLLFGSLLTVDASDARIAWLAATGIYAALLWFRRPMLFWAFEEPAAEAFGAPAQAMKFLLMTLLAIATVVAMKLAGVVLATALLVLPGAAALRLSRRLLTVLALSLAISLAGALGGLAASFKLDMPPGACVVGALIAVYAMTWPIAALRVHLRRADLPRARDAAPTKGPR